LAKRRCAIIKLKNGIWLRLLILLAIIAGSVLVLYETGLFSFFLDKERVAGFLKSLGPFSFIGFIALQAVQVIAAPIPGEVTGFIGGYLYGIVIGILLSTIGLTIGSLAAFSISRLLGRPFVEKFVKKETMDKYDFLLHHKGAFIVFLMFLIPGFPKDTLCYILGLGHLTTKEFFVISTVGRFAGTVLLTLGGSYIFNGHYVYLSILLGVALVLVFLSMVYREKLEKIFRKLHNPDKKEEK
jgi:uncharacterized membrane protein YdjX (TVP38/TMEM64 family)